MQNNWLVFRNHAAVGFVEHFEGAENCIFGVGSGQSLAEQRQKRREVDRAVRFLDHVV